jgi:hypothetical protein
VEAAVTPLALVLFLVGVFGLRTLGAFGLGAVLGDDERWSRLLVLLPLSIVAAVMAVQTFTTRQSVVLDARSVGVGVAALASWRRLPLGLVVVLAAATTALVRKAGWG